MASEKTIKLNNKSDRPDNVILRENEVIEQCEAIQEELPKFLKGYFIYIKSNVLPMTRLAYLNDIRFFCRYLLAETDISDAKNIHELKASDFEKIKGSDVNIFLDYCRRYKVATEKNISIYENHQKALARKKSSISVFFKYLYRDELVSKNITDSFDPIRIPKVGERIIKALEDDEVLIMLDSVESGEGLTEQEKKYWKKTKKRDKAVLILFLTYGLRLSELQQLNVSSFNFNRGEFTIYRKRGKESSMPINKSVEKVVKEYIFEERVRDEHLGDLDKDALFLSLQRRRMTDRQIRELVKKYTAIGMKTSKGGGYSPHKLRATAATSLIGRGNSIFDVQALLDHEQVTTTQLYADHKKNVKRNLVTDMEWELEREQSGNAGSGNDKI